MKDPIHCVPEWVMSHTSGTILCQGTPQAVAESACGIMRLSALGTLDPYSNSSRIAIHGRSSALAFVSVSDILGREVFSMTVNLNPDATVPIHQNELLPGAYVFRVASDGRVVSGKLLIQ